MNVIIKDAYGKVIAIWPVRQDLVELLCNRITEKLAGSNDLFFRLAYENVGKLRGMVVFNQKDDGGRYTNGQIGIGRRSAMSTDDKYADGDIMATIFHEFLHYLNHQYQIFPYRYEDESMGLVYSINVSMGEKFEDEKAFRIRAYNRFIDRNINTPGGGKYMDYPDYNQLDAEQQKEFDQFIVDNKLEPKVDSVRFYYNPSNYFKDELNAHEKTLEAWKMGLFVLSAEKISFYDEEEIRYRNNYQKALIVEERDGYTPEGYEKPIK